MSKQEFYDKAYTRAIKLARRLKLSSNEAFRRFMPRIIEKMERRLE